MKLEIVKLWNDESFNDAITIEPCSMKRKWMTETNDEYAYRCLPLNIANQHGWAIYLSSKTTAVWKGITDQSKDSVVIIDNCAGLAVSHFGYGILTFRLPFLVRLDPEYSLYITGAPNHFIKGIQPCTGVFEADWAPYSFTMNWKLTNPYEVVTFTKDDPICFFFPVHRNTVNNTQTKLSTMEDQDEHYKQQYNQFINSRANFLENNTGRGWEKKYFQGLYPDGTKCPYEHKTKLKPNTFK